MGSEENKKTGLGGHSTVPGTRTKHGGSQAAGQQVNTWTKHRKHCCVPERELSKLSWQAVRPGVLFSVGSSLTFSERYRLCSRMTISAWAW